MRRRNCYRPYGGHKAALWQRILLALIAAAVICFGILEGMVLAGGGTEISGEPRVMVILGCKAELGPSVLLQDRLDTALNYLEDHPDLTVVVSGGRGPDEHITEAQCMYDYLTAHGVPGAQIHREERSHNTWQNINYTRELLEDLNPEGGGKLVVVSSGFHLTRVRMLWDRAWGGTYTLSTLAAPASHVPSRVKMYVREPMALVKSFLFDR